MTSCNLDFYTSFTSSKKPELLARLYKHSDGSPNAMISLLKKFYILMDVKFSSKKADGYGHMFNNGEELAAEFIRLYKPEHGGIAPSMKLVGQYLYEIYTRYDDNEPKIWSIKVYKDKELLETFTIK